MLLGHESPTESPCEARNPDVFPQLEHRDPNLMLPALEIIKAARQPIVDVVFGDLRI